MQFYRFHIYPVKLTQTIPKLLHSSECLTLTFVMGVMHDFWFFVEQILCIEWNSIVCTRCETPLVKTHKRNNIQEKRACYKEIMRLKNGLFVKRLFNWSGFYAIKIELGWSIQRFFSSVLSILFHLILKNHHDFLYSCDLVSNVNS